MTLSPPIRILALVGIIAAAGLGILLFAHNRSASSSTAPAVSPVKPLTHGVVPSTKPAAKPAKPKIVLLPGLPTPIAHSLRFSKVVVVAFYAKGAPGDRPAVTQARAGAKSAHAGFVAVNVVNEKTARSLGTFAKTNALPAVLVVKRPGKIANEFSGYADSEIVAQAALNAGAGR
jgi:hypothetical protein